MCRCTDIMFFQNPPYRASRQLLIPRIAVVGTSFRPMPCQASHGYMVTSVHLVEVEVGADGPTSAPLSGAAAAAPLAGANASLDKCRGSHLKQGCSMDAQTVSGGYDHWLIFQTGT